MFNTAIGPEQAYTRLILNLRIGHIDIWSSRLQVAPLRPYIAYWTPVAVLAAAVADIFVAK